jgi:hypothetical protein
MRKLHYIGIALLLSGCAATPPPCDCAGQLEKLSGEFPAYHQCLNDRGLLLQRLKALEEK